jgi:cation transport ATPase
MAQLGREISTIISSAKGDVSRLRALLHKVAELKWQAAQPEVKLARRFFDAIGFEREMSLVYELYNAEVSRSTLRDIASLQRSAGVLEVMIVGVYALEAVHLFASGALETHFFWALAYLICAPLVIATAVAVSHFGRRQEEAPPTSHGRQFLTIAVLFVLLFSVGGGLAVVSHRAAETEKRQRLQQQERAVAVEKQKEQLAEQESRQRIERLWRELRRLGEAATSPSKQVPGRRTAQ